MKVQLNEITYWVKWQHEHIGSRKITNSGKSAYQTTCDITTEGFTSVASEVAYCSVNDRFNKDTGRKVSLKKALLKLFPDNREARKLFWITYLNR